MRHSLLLVKLFVFLFATNIAAEIGELSTTSAAHTPSTATTTATTKSKSTSAKPQWGDWSGSSKSSNVTTTQKSSKTSSVPAVTHTIPHSISEIIFPSVIPHRPIQPKKIPTGKWGLPQVDTNGKGLLGTIGDNGAPKFPPWIGSSLSGSGGYADSSGGAGGDGGSSSGGSSGGSGGSPGSSGLPGGSGGFGGSGGPKGGPPPGGFPWGNRTAGNTNPYKNPPKTNITRKFDFVVERAILAPDGVETDVIVVNGQFPGPTIEANWGDDIEVTVHNKITGPVEGTSLHWHGLLQKGTPFEDGVPGITQCPIAPGQTFTYKFNADLYGSSWWHAHYSAQAVAGLFGALIIHGPTHVDYDEDLGPVLLTDYYHREYYDIVKEVMGTDLTKVAPLSDNNLINGKGTFDCSTVNTTKCTPNAGYAKFQFETGKKYRLRLINGGAEGVQKFSIDNHNLTVMAYDFVPIVPYETNIITLGVGQRADVIVEATGSAKDSYWLRSTISNCSLTTQPNGYAIIYYQNADTDGKPSSQAWTDTTDICANEELANTTPFFKITPPSKPTTEVSIDLNFGVNATGHLVWTMNNSTFRTCYNDPVLPRAFEISSGTFDCPDEWNVYNFGNASSIRVVVNNLTPAAHPMHIHGHNMYMLSEGVGEWDGTVVNPSNPMRRDCQQLRPASTNADGTVSAPAHMVFQIDADNPGVWPFHCHISWHVSGGLYVNIMERPDDIPKIQVPEEVSGLCQLWNDYSATGTVDQIDSGL